MKISPLTSTKNKNNQGQLLYDFFAWMYIKRRRHPNIQYVNITWALPTPISSSSSSSFTHYQLPHISHLFFYTFHSILFLPCKKKFRFYFVKHTQDLEIAINFTCERTQKQPFWVVVLSIVSIHTTNKHDDDVLNNVCVCVCVSMCVWCLIDESFIIRIFDRDHFIHLNITYTHRYITHL